MRLDKFLVEMELGSRTEVKQLLKKQQVLVNGKVVTSAKVQVDEYQDEISVNNRVLDYEKFVYYLLNKPKGVISATEDANHQTVLDLLDERARQKEVFPVGRLDIDTHGLLLLTNNGALAHAMLSPKKHVAKVYRAKVDGIMTEEDRTRFEAGIKLKDFTCKPAQLTILETNEEQGTSLVEITISEGKFLSTDTNYKSSTPNRLRLFISSCVKRRKVPVANSLSKLNGPIARRSKSATFLPQAATIRFT